MSGDIFDDNPYAPPEDGDGRIWNTWEEDRVFLQDTAGPEPFHAERHSRTRRFSKPAVLVIAIWVLRWTFYLLIPVALCFGGAVLLVFALEERGIPEHLARCGGIVPILMLGIWLWKLPYYYLNGSDLDWQTIRKLKESNGHFDPYEEDEELARAFDAYRPQRYGGFGVFDDPEEPENLDRFISCNINVQMGDPGRITNFLLDTAYFRIENHGIRFFGERIDIYVPYSAIAELVKGTGIYITIKLDRRRLGEFHEFSDIIICLGEKRTFRDERKLRNAIYERMVEDWNAVP